ncbi:HD-GYP domain-containing protein [Fusibacter sp. 3D3]|uniref:HD-GYP domain-containing protein n=1 Tax=Fusibacter sp. 3D3 TaxID=1048380 RepID=UPI000853B8DD|nr:HD-GYP domain-containing protein [Fusibacter sp. 3D3]GAU78922.1 GAF domain/HD domain protein [Fusibacter sp. 3D3]
MELKKFGKKIKADNSSRGLITLLGTNDGVEIVQFDIKKSGFLFIKPSIIPDTYEFYYIITGYLENNSEILGPGDYFEVQNLEESFSLTAVEDTVLLFFASRSGEYELSKKMHTKLHEQLETLQNKDHYTYQHSKNVKRICAHLAKQLKLSATATRHLLLAATFHDIGKTQIPDSILNKNAKLTPAENEIMKKHVVYSYEIVLKEMDEEVANIILNHHERPDGSGYPHGLKDDAITLEASILALADSFDAMTTDRVYKKSKTYEEALSELKIMAPAHYNLDLIHHLENLVQSPAFCNE